MLLRCLLCSILLLGCSSGLDPGDGVEVGADAGLRDGPMEAGVVDAASKDAGSTDAGARDADAEDATTEDASPGLDASEIPTCGVAGVTAECSDVTTCDGTSFYGRCPGPPRSVCCLDDVPCSVSGAPGLCLDVSVCPGVSTPGLCPGPADIQCCTDPAEACDESAAPVPNEGLTEVSYDTACPDGMVLAGTFCIDKYEAALVEIGGGHWSPFLNPGATPVRAVSLEYAVPQGYISGLQAADACAAAGKRLCTDAEWLSACRGANDLTYPYGDVREDGRCNDARARHPAIEYFGSSDPSVFSQIGNRCINQIPASLALTGEHAACVSPTGALDMMGNLHEWTADPAGTFRGGFYVDTRINGEGCLYATTAHDTSHWDYSTGFRCCADPL